LNDFEYLDNRKKKKEKRKKKKEDDITWTWISGWPYTIFMCRKVRIALK